MTTNEAADPGIRMPGIFRVLQSYRRQNVEVVLSSPDNFSTQLARNGSLLSISAGISLSDILVFQWIAESAPWTRAFVIGNAFGFSTFVIASLCPGCRVDAIDAEIEGAQNTLGSKLTREMSRYDFPGVRLTTGFSPQDIPSSARFDTYDFIFIDGMHTNRQLLADYEAVKRLRSERSVVYLHDVGIARMGRAWDIIRRQQLEPGDEAFDLHFTSFGSTAVVRGMPELSRFLREACRPLASGCYYFGAQGTGIRTACRMLRRTAVHALRTRALHGRHLWLRFGPGLRRAGRSVPGLERAS